MRFIDPNLTVWENMNNTIITLSILGAIVLILVWVANLTAKTEEKKNEAKTIFFYGVPAAIIAIVISLILYLVIKMNYPALATTNERKEINLQTQYQSATVKEDCRLCGKNPNDLLQFYFGENNVAVLDLNTFDFLRLDINRYDDEHNLIEQKAGSTQIITNRTKNGEMWNFTINSDRGYSDGSVTLKENSKLSLDRLSIHLCSDCLTAVMNEYTYKENHCNIALINFENKKIIPLQECVTGFSFGDFYVKSRYEKVDDKVSLLVWYSPIRYK